MLKSFRKLKVLAAASALVIAIFAAGVAHGGVLWTGIDPELMVGEHKVNIWTEWPEQYNCDVDDIFISVAVPYNMDFTFMGESEGEYDCEDGATHRIETRTHINQLSLVNLRVGGVLKSSEDFPVRFKVYLDDELALTCKGESNEYIRCDRLRLLPLNFDFDFGDFFDRDD